MSHPPPNESLAELADVLGPENVKTLVRTFLRDFPISIDDLASGDRASGHRFAHSMKSNARLMGAFELSNHMARVEEMLSKPAGGNVTTQDIAAIKAEFESVAVPLRVFVSD